MDNTGLIAALGPAFASGMALQRLLEILDPVVNQLVGEGRKRLVLGLVSLIIGLGMAYGLDLHVLIPLGVEPSLGLNVLDYLVTGLIISAGTEGFNSIIKFLSYKKEEQKAETIGESLGLNAALLNRSKEMENFMATNMNLTLATPEDTLKEALQAEVRAFKKDEQLVLDFKTGKFNQHMVSDNQAQVVTLKATADAAKQFHSKLNSKGKQIVRQSINLGTGYGAAVGVMLEAVAKGTDPEIELV